MAMVPLATMKGRGVDKVLEHTRNVVDNKGPKMGKMRKLGHTRNVIEKKLVSSFNPECYR
jgi:hypothetical protein